MHHLEPYLTSFPPWAKAPKLAVRTWRKENSCNASWFWGGGGGGGGARNSGAALELGVIGATRTAPAPSTLHALPPSGL